jgi:hypothetical protein
VPNPEGLSPALSTQAGVLQLVLDQKFFQRFIAELPCGPQAEQDVQEPLRLCFCGEPDRRFKKIKREKKE